MSAVFSPDMLYRYELERQGVGIGTTAVIMVNPSTADADLDDATIRKVRGFGRVYYLGRLLIGNLFAYRATDIKKLREVDDPIGPDNDWHIDKMLRESDRVLFAWGRLSKLPAAFRTRWTSVYELAKNAGHNPLCLGVGKDGHPRHPLMLPYETTRLEPWRIS